MKMRMHAMAAAIALIGTQAAWAGEPEARKWVDSEFQPSSLSKDQQMAEMKWFIDAAEKLKAKGVSEINVVSETITTHEYEAKTLARAFTEITGIKVNHDLIQEGDVVEKLQTSMQSGKSIYDGWISDSDLIGTHYRYGAILPLSDYISGAGKEYTNPGLDLKDFIGTKFTTAPDGKLYQLPDQQFANVYWFRADWFARKDLQDKFKAKYGYELGVPTNWSAYEDIAEFFSNDVKELDGKRVYGHMDYGKKDPSLGWRFTDAWLSMAGAADKGLPNGMPVDEWGIRVADDKCTPVGASVARGGGHQQPGRGLCADQVRGLDEEVRAAAGHRHDLLRIRPGAGAGQIAQQIFWYTAFTADMTKKGLPVVNEDGTPKWRMAPSPLWTVLEGWHAERLPGRRFVDILQVHRRQPPGRRVALRAVRDVQDGVAEEVHHRPDLHPRQRHQQRVLHQERGQLRRPGRVLPQPGARGVDAHRQQRARLSQAGAAVVEERGHRGHGREDAAAGHGHAGQRNGSGAGAAGARRHGAVRA